MAEVYVYSPHENDCSTIGICGRLEPTSCTFHEIANGDSSLELEHPYDEMLRYTCLEEGCILKAPVPVRNVPEVTNGQYVTSILQCFIRDSATVEDRKVYNKKKDGKKIGTVPIGAEIFLLKRETGADRCKVSYSTTTKKGKNKTVTGWLKDDNELVFREVTTIQIDGAKEFEEYVPSWEIKEQLFRIYSVEKSENSVKVEAKHISYDEMYNITKYESTEQTTLANATKGIVNNCVIPSDLDIETTISGQRVGLLYNGKDPMTAILDPEEGLTSRFEGQLVRDNNDLYILHDCGMDRGVVLDYGKNVSGVTYSVDTSNIATGILPVGENKDKTSLYLDKSYVQNGDSFDEITGDTRGIIFVQNHADYAVEHISLLNGQECTVTDKKGEHPTKTEVLARLLEQGKQAVLNGCAEPEITVKVDFETIGDSLNYPEYKGLQVVFLYDYASVRYHRDGMDIINVSVTVSEIKWDVIKERMEELTLGTLKDLTSKISSWQVKNGNSNTGGIGDMTIVSTILAELNNPNSDIYKRVYEIAKG